MPDDKVSGVDELAKLFPQPESVDIGGKTITIRPLTVRQVGQVAKLLKPVADSIGNQIEVGRLLAEHTEAAIAVIVIATGEPEAWVADLPADQGLVLAMAVFKVNRDFFVARVAPLVPVLMTSLSAGVGATRSPTLSATAT